METEQPTPTAAQRRATEAAEALAVEGKRVSSRAVRVRAEVSMGVAVEVARKWNQSTVKTRRIPEAPAEWRARLDALWPTAYETATAEFDVEREELTAELQASDDENHTLTDEVITLEAQIEEPKATIAEAERAAAVREDEFAAERDALTAQLQVSKDEGQALANELAESKVRVGELTTALRDAELATSDQARQHVVKLAAEQSRASRAEGALEAVTAERDRLLAAAQSQRSTSGG